MFSGGNTERGVIFAEHPAPPRREFHVKRERADMTILRADLWIRSKGKCEFCLRPLRDGAELHHRRLRSHGGGDTLENCVLIHPACHRWAHANPSMAREWGWLVSGWADPADVRIQHGLPWLRQEGAQG